MSSIGGGGDDGGAGEEGGGIAGAGGVTAAVVVSPLFTFAARARSTGSHPADSPRNVGVPNAPVDGEAGMPDRRLNATLSANRLVSVRRMASSVAGPELGRGDEASSADRSASTGDADACRRVSSSASCCWKLRMRSVDGGVGTAARSGGTDPTGGACRPVTRMIRSITPATTTINHVWTCRGRTPRGRIRRSWTPLDVETTAGAACGSGRTSVMALPSSDRVKSQQLLAEPEVAVFEHLRHDVEAVLHLKGDQVRAPSVSSYSAGSSDADVRM